MKRKTKLGQVTEPRINTSCKCPSYNGKKGLRISNKKFASL